MITGNIYYGYNITNLVEATLNPEVHEKVLELIDGGFLDGDPEMIDCGPTYIGSMLGVLEPEDVLSVKNVLNFVSKHKNDELVTRYLDQLKSQFEDIEEDVEVFAAHIMNLEETDRDVFIVWNK